jgi:23S rRNA (guanosine2251-2'-O)-methyltransferase
MEKGLSQLLPANVMFCTVLHNLKSPENVGMIVRSHVAFRGDQVVFVGRQLPWQFKKSTQAFSRKLERQCEIVYIETDDDFFKWCSESNYTPVAIEIGEKSALLPNFRFPTRAALVVGGEAKGLSAEFIERCPHSVMIPQFGNVECLNVAVSASIAMYELKRSDTKNTNDVLGSKFAAKQ